jgi:hypothetical protein
MSCRMGGDTQHDGQKLRQRGMETLKFKAEARPHVIDRHRLSLPSASAPDKTYLIYNE